MTSDNPFLRALQKFNANELKALEAATIRRALIYCANVPELVDKEPEVGHTYLELMVESDRNNV